MSTNSRFHDLKQEIIETNKCTGCGACIAICPVQCLSLNELEPYMLPADSKEMKQPCIDCGLCHEFCPRVEITNQFSQGSSTILNRGNVFTAQTTDEQLRGKCQDGGVVTSILKYLFSEDLIDGAVVSKFDSSWKPIPVIVQGIEDLEGSSGTRYSVSPNLSVLSPRYLERKLALPYDNINGLRLAFVGTPCQISAIRKMQSHSVKAPIFPSNLIKITIGLFCMENFDHEGLVKEFTNTKLGIRDEQIRKMDISKGKLFVYTDDEPKVTPIKDLNSYARNACHYCKDFSNALADISVGSVGSQGGWSTVVIRTEIGEKAFTQARIKGYIEVDSVRHETIAAIQRLENIKNKKAKA
ncbi:MAG: Coenzyme F420 hydrogenase/dehydrogenase, beta subunit C-terminal domain [Candidatus Helarchaeota archaeon]